MDFIRKRKVKRYNVGKLINIIRQDLDYDKYIYKEMFDNAGWEVKLFWKDFFQYIVAFNQ